VGEVESEVRRSEELRCPEEGGRVRRSDSREEGLSTGWVQW